MDTQTKEDMLADIAQRAAAVAVEQVKADPTSLAIPDEARIREWFSTFLGELKDDDPFVRKMRFGAAEPDLIGSKFHRFGLNTADIEWLYDTQNSLRGQSRKGGGVYQGPSEELQKAFDAVSDAYYIPQEEIRKIDQQALDGVYPRQPKGRQRLEQAQAQRAMDTAETGFGLQLVGAQYVGDLWEAARPESRVFGLIDTFEMTAPTAYLPVEVDIPEMMFVSESTANNSSNYSTVKTGSQRVQVDAKKFVIHQMWSGEMEEDSIIAYVPFLRRQAALGLAHFSDALVLNGDTTNAATGNINLDDADPADTKYYLAFDGIRHAALVDNTANASDAAAVVPTLEMLKDLRGLLMDTTRIVDWGHPTNTDDLVYIADPETADNIATLDEMIMWKIQQGGPPLLSGQVGQILLHPVISSMAMSKTEADGKVSTTGANNIKGQVTLFNRRGFKAGWRRRVQVETERLPATDQMRIVYSLRLGFGRFSPTGAASGIEATSTLYNLAI